jgi:hypothetical protein
MRKMVRRDALKALGAATIAASGAMLPVLKTGGAADLRYAPEKDAALKVLRWKRFVQGDEDLWAANTRKFTEHTGVTVQVESVNGEDLRPKGAMAANVGAGPDILIGPSDMPQLYPGQCVDLTEVANYLGKKYGGWYDACRHYGMLGGRWISLHDASNNKAFLAGDISLTYNPISIYYVAKNSGDAAMKAIAADIRHAHMPIGPVGHPTDLNSMLTAFVFKYCRFPNAKPRIAYLSTSVNLFLASWWDLGLKCIH